MLMKLRVVGFVALLMFAFSGTAAASEAKNKDVFVIEDGQRTSYRTKLDTIEEFFTEEEIVLKDKDEINVDITGALRHSMKIEIRRGSDIVIKTSKKSITERVGPGTLVGTVVNQYSQEDGVEYVYDGGLNEIIHDGMVVNLREKRTETVVTKELLPYESSTLELEDLAEGEQLVAVEGKDGEKEITTEITYFDGEETDRRIIGEVIVSEPVHEVIHLGTARTLGALADIENLDYANEYMMEATAYTAGHESTGKYPGHPAYGITASGMQVEHGIVSVDPNVIPLGTELYVEGYGYGLAADTGSAIKGHKIDLFYESYNDAIQFGRRKLKVYVLK